MFVLVYIDTLIHSIKTGSIEMLKWVLRLMEKTRLTKPTKVNAILSFAAFKPEMLEICLKKLNAWGLLSFFPNFVVGDQQGAALAVLCYANAPISDLKIWKHVKRLPVESTEHKFMGLNCLQYCIRHMNIDSIEVLLQNDEWRSKLLYAEQGFGSVALQYAREFGNEAIQSIIYWKLWELISAVYYWDL